ncbi:hypothetical protein [Agromyces albus]|uniref:hypothetical protein n=1 Tax=Agromyces albus TaxID=205332 RepID=UPI002780A266|nr:hypothetical protein [Agromyces albus]MDQ0577257.1 putative iron-regulated membrane protein [Agromyces albus]
MAIFMQGLEVALGVLALVALVVGIVAFIRWFAAPRMGAEPSREQVLERVWISALVVAAVLGLLVFVIGRDVMHLL